MPYQVTIRARRAGALGIADQKRTYAVPGPLNDAINRAIINAHGEGLEHVEITGCQSASGPVLAYCRENT